LGFALRRTTEPRKGSGCKSRDFLTYSKTIRATVSLAACGWAQAEPPTLKRFRFFSTRSFDRAAPAFSLCCCGVGDPLLMRFGSHGGLLCRTFGPMWWSGVLRNVIAIPRQPEKPDCPDDSPSRQKRGFLAPLGGATGGHGRALAGLLDAEESPVSWFRARATSPAGRSGESLRERLRYFISTRRPRHFFPHPRAHGESNRPCFSVDERLQKKNHPHGATKF